MTAAAKAARPRASNDIFSAKCLLLGPRLMRDLRLTDLQAAGLLGNLGHESGGFRTLQEVHPRGGRGGWGLAQWTGPRRTAMERWCRSHKFSVASDEGNYQYLCIELRGAESGALKALQQQHTIEAATHSFCDHFERPGVKAYISRVGYARKALAAIRKGLASHEAAVTVIITKPPVVTIPSPAIALGDKAVAKAPVKAKAPAKKPASDKHAIVPKPKAKPRAVRKHAAPVAHIVHRGKRR